jgi:hypothetical protein
MNAPIPRPSANIIKAERTGVRFMLASANLT